MKFYFDESGSFHDVDAPDQHAVSVAVGLGGSDAAVENLLQAWRSFRSTLGPSELKDGEVKGGRLLASSRRHVCSLLFDRRDIIVCPIILDLTHLHGQADAKLANLLAEQLIKIGSHHPDDDVQTGLTEIAEVVRRLSTQQMRRMYSWACAADRVLRYSADFRWAREWRNTELVFDHQGDTEHQLFPSLLPLLLRGWSHLQPIRLPRPQIDAIEWAELEADGTIQLGRLGLDSIRFADSKLEDGIQVADVAASIVRTAAKALGENDAAREEYGLLLRSCPYREDMGLVTPLMDRGGANSKYKRLGDEAAYARLRRFAPNGAICMIQGDDLEMLCGAPPFWFTE